ncbi:glycosyltransferase family 4 protein [Patescibacteria group bacterium]|nr:glycosyltransferase family 4 protein [Patescibacteria group bacterium]
MKKILIFSLSYYPQFTSGAEAAIKEITDRIKPDDYEFHMVTNRYDSKIEKVEKIGNVLVHRIGITKKNPTFEDLGRLPLDINKPLYQFLAAWKALWLHRKYKYDGIWSMMAHSAGVPAAIFKIFNPKVSYILTLQEGDSPEYIEKTMKPLWPLFKRAFTSADIIQSISTFLSEWARKRNFEGPIELIHNGANPRDVAAVFDEQEIENLRKELGKKEGDIFLVNTARLVYQKATNITIQALKLLPENIKFIIVGGGDEVDMLKTLTKELDLEHRVVFVGKVDRSVVTNYRKAADIFVCPSRSEGLGNAFLSAMASKLPVIATQAGGIKEFLFDKKHNPDKTETGWVVDVDSPEQIAQAVKDILANPEKVARITNNAREMVLRKFNWDMVAKDMQEKVFNRVIK